MAAWPCQPVLRQPVFGRFLGVTGGVGRHLSAFATSGGERGASDGLGTRSPPSMRRLNSIYVYGADEIDDQLRLIKGGGGRRCLAREDLATASDRIGVIADESNS